MYVGLFVDLVSEKVFVLIFMCFHIGVKYNLLLFL